MSVQIWRVAKRAAGAMLVTAMLAGPARSEAQGGNLPAGMTPHVQVTKFGRIDWAKGHVTAIGVGKAKSDSPRDRQMAERGATIVAARNAMALTMGLKVDDQGRLSGLKNGTVSIQGKIREHKVFMVDWRPDDTPPTCQVKLRVPLWGVKGVCTVIYDQVRRETSRRGGSRVVLKSEQTDVSRSWLVIDARGLGTEPSLFPTVVDESGRVVYDVVTIRDTSQEAMRPVRYAESRLSFEELSARAGLRADSDSGAAAEPDASRPMERLRMVRAVRSTSSKSRIVLANDDASALSQSAECASLLRGGRVIVLVDSPEERIEIGQAVGAGR